MILTQNNLDRMQAKSEPVYLEDDDIIYKQTGIDYNKVLLIAESIFKKPNFKKFIGLTNPNISISGWSSDVVDGTTVYRTDILDHEFLEFATISIFENNVISLTVMSKKSQNVLIIEVSNDSTQCYVTESKHIIDLISNASKEFSHDSLKIKKIIPIFKELTELKNALV